MFCFRKAIKANIKLNTKRLYQADGYAVKELLKITMLLYEALRENAQNDHNEMDDDDNEGEVNMRDFDVSDKVLWQKYLRKKLTLLTSYKNWNTVRKDFIILTNYP